MPRNGSGTYSSPSSSWNPAVAGTTISSTDWAALLSDLASAVTASIANDGQTPTTASIPFAAGLTSTTGSFSGTLTAQGLVDASAAAAGQIKFPATQNASANANTLDDYEEGTWTPSIGGTATYTTQIGTYTKIGRMVFIRCQFQVNIIGTGVTTSISGLPFTSATSSSGGLVIHNFVSLVNPVTWIVAQVTANATTVSFNATTAAQTTITGALGIFGDGARIDFSGWYEATA